MRAVQSLAALNRGVVSRLGLARTDVKRIAMAAQVQTNWMPRVLGSMMLRPGLKYLGSTASNAEARFLRFIFATDDTSLIELTNTALRVWINDVVLTRSAVTSTIANPNFTGSLASWTQQDEAGATSSWGGANNSMALHGNGTAYAIREQHIVIAAPMLNVEHGLRVVISLGPVVLRVGSTSGGDNYVSETTLRTGTHSFGVTPTADMYISFRSCSVSTVTVYSCNFEAAGAMSLPTPWLAADLGKVRYDQSGDVLFIACAGYQQRRIERRGTRPGARSWSVVLYDPQDGPFQVMNTSPIKLTPAAISGDVVLTASENYFKPGHVGALFSITSLGQVVSTTASASATPTASIRVTGVGTDRTISLVVSGDATASTVDLQRSYDNATWANVGGTMSTTVNITTTYADGLDNQIVYYRAMLTTRVAPDNVTMQLRIGSGSIRGVVRVYGYTSATQVNVSVLSPLGGTTASADWQEGSWSDLRGWPTAVRLHEGRLWWMGKNGIFGSISDAFDSFDETFVGNAGPINRTIGSGPVDTINWGVSLKGLLLGAQGAEFTVRSSSLDEPLTPTNFNVKSPSTQGSSSVDAVKVDQSGYFVNRSGTKVFELSFDLRSYDYQSTNLMELLPDGGRPGIVRMDVQRLPDTRVHCVRSDGVAMTGVINKAEEVLAWVGIATSGSIEDVVVLPAISGNSDDQVYYVVRRTINGATVRYLEKWAQEIDCLGDKPLCYLADAHIAYTGAATTVITGLSHLEGQSVVVWADSHDVGTVDTARPWTQRYTVAGGQITLAVAASNVVVGLGYTAQFQSAKLGATLNGISPLNQQKNINHFGVILADTHAKGIKVGPTLADTGSMCMDDLPGIEDGVAVGDVVRSEYDQNLIEFPGTWTTDMRLCLQAQAPRPATVLAITYDADQNS